MESLTPGQQVIKIVQEELTKLMGEGKRDLNLNDKKPASLMLVGLQGSGKTTTAGKLANYIRKMGTILTWCRWIHEDRLLSSNFGR